MKKLALILLFLTGCATVPPTEQISPTINFNNGGFFWTR